MVLLQYAVVGLQMDRVGLEARYAWETSCLGATQIELDYWISSPQPLKSIGKGSQGLRDCEVEKGMIPGVGFMDVLEFMLDLV